MLFVDIVELFVIMQGGVLQQLEKFFKGSQKGRQNYSIGIAAVIFVIIPVFFKVVESRRDEKIKKLLKTYLNRNAQKNL